MTSKRVGLYARVSTDGQDTTNQIRELEQVAERKGWTIAERFIDNAKRREQRPAFNRLWKAAVRREIDVVAAWSVDRLGRSLPDLVNFFAELQSLGCGLYLHREAVDSSTPNGMAMLQMCGVFAQYERSMIRERVLAGLARARAQGKVLGRPSVAASVEKTVRAMLAEGCGVRATARAAACSTSVVQRIKAAG